MNTCCHTGNLTKDPETTTNNDTTITKFSIAVNDSKNEVSFLDMVAFGKSAEFVQKYFTKGKSIAVESRYKQERWEKDGKQQSAPRFYVNRVSFTGGKSDNGGDSQGSMPNFS